MASLDGTPQNESVSALVYINKGPFFDDLNLDKFFENVLGSPLSFEIHQSINGMFRYGYITFEDRVGIRETLPLTGNEILTIRYKNGSTGTEVSEQPRTIHFNVYDIEETQISATDMDRFTRKGIKFHVIEAPFFLKYSGDVWTRSFGKPDDGMFVHDIFSNHLTNDLKINNTLFKLDIQKMQTKMHFCSPAWRSQMIFSYLLQYARDENGYGNVKFFTTTDPQTNTVVINLKSLNQMFSTTKAREFSLVDESAYNSSKGSGYISQRSLNHIIQHKFLSYDLTALSSGFPGAHMLNYDYVQSKYFTLRDNYRESIARKENAHFYNFALWSDKIASDQSKRLYIGQVQKDLAKSYLNNKIVEHQFQLRCETMTYIDESINPGDKIVIYFLSGMVELSRDQQHLLDEQMSGAWIVEEIVDTSANGVGFRKMVLVKDSFFNVYDVTSGSANSKTLPNVHTVFKDDFKG